VKDGETILSPGWNLPVGILTVEGMEGVGFMFLVIDDKMVIHQVAQGAADGRVGRFAAQRHPDGIHGHRSAEDRQRPHHLLLAPVQQGMVPCQPLFVLPGHFLRKQAGIAQQFFQVQAGIPPERICHHGHLEGNSHGFLRRFSKCPGVHTFQPGTRQFLQQCCCISRIQPLFQVHRLANPGIMFQSQRFLAGCQNPQAVAAGHQEAEKEGMFRVRQGSIARLEAFQVVQHQQAGMVGKQAEEHLHPGSERQ